ncbi:MAG: hypothetical protein ACOVSW_16275 [Candidatus Kapaibacteriota bacterium]
MKRFLNASMLVSATALLMGISIPTFSQTAAPSDDKKAAAKAKWESLTPEQRENLKAEFKEKAKEKWDAMPPEEREAAKAKFKEKAKEKYKNATPEEKAKMKEKMKERREKRQAGGN